MTWVQTPVITIGSLPLTDLARPDLLDTISRLVTQGSGSTHTVMYSLHVEGLNQRRNAEFRAAMERATLVVPDGVSVSALLRVAGGAGHRHPTTDVGWELLEVLSQQISPLRVALIGGAEGVAEQAASVVQQKADVQIAYTTHGFHTQWEPVLRELRDARPDVLIVGMGMPREAVWVDQHRDVLPGRFTLTCGGWFGHMIGDEKRAPRWMRRAGLEWVARLAQQPRRLWKRYTTGIYATLALIPAAVRARGEQKRQLQQ